MLKKLFVALSIVMIMALLTTANVLAVSTSDNPGNNPKSISEIAAETLTKKDSTSSDGKVKKHEINNIKKFKDAIKQNYPKMSGLDIAKNIMMATGDDAATIASFSDEKILEVLNCESFEQTESFYIESQNAGGPPIQVDEDTFYKHVKEVKEKEKTKEDKANTSPTVANFITPKRKS